MRRSARTAWSAREAFAALQPTVAAFNKQLADTALNGGETFGTLASMAGIVGNEVSGKALDANQRTVDRPGGCPEHRVPDDRLTSQRYA
jgi:hypothetical protein